MKRNAKRNCRVMYYALYKSKEMIYDEDDNPTMEYRQIYHSPVKFFASVSIGKSNSEDLPFGADASYDRVITTHDKTLPVDETSLIWLNAAPEFKDGKLDSESADYKVAAPVLDGLDSLRIAIKFNK